MKETGTEKGRQLDADGEARRNFLRKSAYAAYATPVIWSLLVEKANATQSSPASNPDSGYTVPPGRVNPDGSQNTGWRPGGGFFGR